jgi:hypothetical protein
VKHERREGEDQYSIDELDLWTLSLCRMKHCFPVPCNGEAIEEPRPSFLLDLQPLIFCIPFFILICEYIGMNSCWAKPRELDNGSNGDEKDHKCNDANANDLSYFCVLLVILSVAVSHNKVGVLKVNHIFIHVLIQVPHWVLYLLLSAKCRCANSIVKNCMIAALNVLDCDETICEVIRRSFPLTHIIVS